jgi:hypothetical protein
LAAPRDESHHLEPDAIRFVGREEIAWYAPRRDLSEDAYRAKVVVTRPLPTFTAGLPGHPVWVEVTLDLVHENVRWFEEPVIVPVEAGPSADQRLTALTERFGPLIPVEELMAERRAISGPNALLRPGPETASDPAIAALTDSLPVGAWPVDAPAIDRLVEVVRDEDPGSIVEFGSGTSTVILASLLAERHGDGLRLLSFGQDPAWAAQTQATLSARGLDGVGRVVLVPVGERAESPPGYLPTAEATELLARLEPELISVDGPTLASGASRLAAVEIVAPYLRQDATLLLDDAPRRRALCRGDLGRSRRHDRRGGPCYPKGPARGDFASAAAIGSAGWPRSAARRRRASGVASPGGASAGGTYYVSPR